MSEWTIENVGVTNGVIDAAFEARYSPEFVYNNTYTSLIPEEVYNEALDSYTADGGCVDLVEQCREAATLGDPEGTGTNSTVNELCREANNFCLLNVGSTAVLANVSMFDIAAATRPDGQDGCPYYFPAAFYLNSEPVQRALGVPLNFTYISSAVLDVYTTTLPAKPDVGTGDTFRANQSHIEYLLQNDIKVALVYGDRDARCPWIATEALALTFEHDSQEAYNAAGYEFITTNDTYQGGAVKQYDNLSFSRVFQAGHMVNAYQPETVYRIFARTIAGRDVATGEREASGGYSTEGPSSSFDFVDEELPEKADTCMVLGEFDEVSVLDALAEQGGGGEGGQEEGEQGGGGGGSGDGSSEDGEDSESAAAALRLDSAALLAMGGSLAVAVSLLT